MNTIEIVLPCGFTTKYINLETSSNEIDCPVCKTHSLNIKEVLNLPNNWIAMREKEYNDTLKIFETLKFDLTTLLNDPKTHLEANYTKLLQDLEMRREEVKTNICSKIDEYYLSLREKLLDEKTTQFNSLLEETENLKKLLNEETEMNSKPLDNSSDKIKMAERDLLNLNEKIGKALSNFKGSKYEFDVASEQQQLDLKNLFGKLIKKNYV